MDYHKITRADCISVSTGEEKTRLAYITDIALLKKLAMRWCSKNGYKLGGYLGGDKWDATKG